MSFRREIELRRGILPIEIASATNHRDDVPRVGVDGHECRVWIALVGQGSFADLFSNILKMLVDRRVDPQAAFENGVDPVRNGCP